MNRKDIIKEYIDAQKYIEIKIKYFLNNDISLSNLVGLFNYYIELQSNCFTNKSNYELEEDLIRIFKKVLIEVDYLEDKKILIKK